MSRRNQIDLTDQEIEDYIANARTIILVSNGRNGYPHPMPMWFARDDEGRIIMSTFRKSQKVHNLHRDPKATLLIESGDAYEELKGLVMRAEAEIIDDLEETVDAMYRVSLARGDTQSAAEQAMKEGARSGLGQKRVKIVFHPKSIVSWDHKKLGGVY